VKGLAAAVLIAAATAGSAGAAEPERWAGVDESVVERAASSAGRTRWRTFLDGSGDLPLFAFLCAGVVGGFVLGYGYRALFAERRRSPPEKP
jgi:hypothetical protein